MIMLSQAFVTKMPIIVEIEEQIYFIPNRIAHPASYIEL